MSTAETIRHELTFIPDEDPQGYGDGLDDRWTCSCGADFGRGDIEEAFAHGRDIGAGRA